MATGDELSMKRSLWKEDVSFANVLDTMPRLTDDEADDQPEDLTIGGGNSQGTRIIHRRSVGMTRRQFMP